MQQIQAIVIGASAGGTEALLALLPALPPTLRVPVFVVLHQPRDRPSLLVNIFQGRCAFDVSEASDKMSVHPCTIYFAPPDYHMLLEKDRTIALSADSAVQFARPSIDVLFESASDVYAQHLLGIILTGANQDGAAGLRAIRDAGGMTIVQDPMNAKVSLMPESAIAAVPDATAMTLEQMANFFRTLKCESES